MISDFQVCGNNFLASSVYTVSLTLHLMCDLSIEIIWHGIYCEKIQNFSPIYGDLYLLFGLVWKEIRAKQFINIFKVGISLLYRLYSYVNKKQKINDFSWFKIYLHNQIYLLPCTTYHDKWIYFIYSTIHKLFENTVWTPTKHWFYLSQVSLFSSKLRTSKPHLQIHTNLTLKPSSQEKQHLQFALVVK